MSSFPAQEEGGSHHALSAVVPAPSTTHAENRESSLAHQNSLSSDLPPLSSEPPPCLRNTDTLFFLRGSHVSRLTMLVFRRLFHQRGMLCEIHLVYTLGFTVGKPFHPGSVAGGANVPLPIRATLQRQSHSEHPALAGQISSFHSSC